MRVITQKQYENAIKNIRSSAERHMEDAKSEVGIDNLVHHIKAAVLTEVAESMEEAISDF
jgi:ribosomal protein L31E